VCVESPPVEGAVTSISYTPPLVEEEAQLLNTFMSRREQKSSSWIPTGLETKNYYAGEGQQHFNRSTRIGLMIVILTPIPWKLVVFAYLYRWQLRVR
jgi:hypothetical protein